MLQYFILAMGLLISWGLAGAVVMMSLFGMAAIVNENGSLSPQEKATFSRCTKLSIFTVLFLTIPLIILALSKSDYYSPYYLLLPIGLNLLCVKKILSGSKEPKKLD